MPGLDSFSWETLKVQRMFLIAHLLIVQQPSASLNRLTPWGLTIWRFGRSGITAVGLRGKSGCRQVDSEVNIAVLVSWWPHQRLGRSTPRLWVQAVVLQFHSPRVKWLWCKPACCSSLRYDMAGALVLIQENKGRKCLFCSSQKIPLNYALPILLKLWHHPEKQFKFIDPGRRKRNPFLYFLFWTHTTHSDNSWFLSLFQPQEETPEPRIPHLFDRWFVLLPFRNILSAVNCCIAICLFCMIASILAKR